MALEGVEPAGPQGAVGLQPGVERHQRLDAQAVEPTLRPEPLMALDAWLEPYRAHWAGRLDALERHLERSALPADVPPDRPTDRPTHTPTGPTPEEHR